MSSTFPSFIGPSTVSNSNSGMNSAPQSFIGPSTSSNNNSGMNSAPQSFIGPSTSSNSNSAFPSFIGPSTSSNNNSAPSFATSKEIVSIPQSFIGSAPQSPQLKSISIENKNDITNTLRNANEMMYVSELTIKNCNEVKEDLVIENAPNLEKIIVKKESLKNLKSLRICNNEKLKSIVVEDGAWLNGAFWNVKNVIIESMFEMSC